jgi:predicted dehydrogenase
MADRLGVAVVGLGIGEQHARMYASLPQCEVRALVDLDRTRAVRLAVGFPGSAALTDFNDVLDKSGIDIVSIASFDDVHCAQVIAALGAGKHVFVEKPLCRTPGELAEVRKALDARPKLHLASNLVLRGADLFRWLRAEIAAGAFGEIYAFDGDYLYGRLHKITDGWRGDTEHYSVMLGGGIHMIDLLLWLTGQRPEHVQGAGTNLATRGSRFHQDDFTAATLTFSSGLVARITANFACMHPHQHVVRIFGTRQTFILDDAGPRLLSQRDPLERDAPVAHAQSVALAATPANKGALIPEFVRCIVSGAPARNDDLDVTLDAIAVAAACDEAAASAQPIKITYQ